jgi:hypothetical protein
MLKTAGGGQRRTFRKTVYSYGKFIAINYGYANRSTENTGAH